MKQKSGNKERIIMPTLIILILLTLLFTGCSNPVKPPFEQCFYAPDDFNSDIIETLYDVKMFCKGKGYNPEASISYHEDGFSQNPIIKIKCSNQEDKRKRKSLIE